MTASCVNVRLISCVKCETHVVTEVDMYDIELCEWLTHIVTEAVRYDGELCEC